MNKNNRFDGIYESIKKGGELSPFLFLSENLELLHNDIQQFMNEVIAEYGLDKQSIFSLHDTGENLKIDEVKRFISQGEVKSRFAFQVFFIENISRMTTQAANACLKFFEEPGEGNIIILTNSSEAGILETILSRVQIQKVSGGGNSEANTFYLSMIESHVAHRSDELVRYFFSGKYEKTEYVDFLKTLIHYIAQSGKFIELLDELHEDIGGILKNNLQGRYVVDKYIMLLGKSL